MTTKRQINKGEQAEEALRLYFLSLGNYVIRSVPFDYKGFIVTDIDLWLYMKSSSLSRERICVDVKRKKTPQAMERIFWAKGLKEVLSLDRAIVVTTDNRKETRDFGTSHDISVLPGEFLSRVVNRYSINEERITEETLLDQLRTPCLMCSNISWTQFLKEAKSCLINQLNFSGCNLLLSKIRFLIEEYLASNKSSIGALRLLYLHISYFLIGVDFSSRNLTHLDINSRKLSFDEGFRYGNAGKERADEILRTAMQLLEDTSNSDLFSYSKLEDEIKNQLSEYPAEVLAEYFARSEVMKTLFALAGEFEQNAYAKSIIKPDVCDRNMKSLLGLLCDFLHIDRRKLI
ncbi:hypothetical protein BVY01_04295 [bacterium I07]|nr:hypothetical protein BVY01_04295 [bacterium I07]